MAEAIELDWVALPMKPSAIIKAMEKSRTGNAPRHGRFSSQAVRNVKRRAADVFAVADHAVFLRQNGFCKMVDMPKMADNHIQKNGTRAAGGNRSGYAGNVTGTDLRGNRHGKLEIETGICLRGLCLFLLNKPPKTDLKPVP